jgi:hypothetical protein
MRNFRKLLREANGYFQGNHPRNVLISSGGADMLEAFSRSGSHQRTLAKEKPTRACRKQKK